MGEEEHDRVRPWPSPRCQYCGRPLQENARIRTLEFGEPGSGATFAYRFLFCGSCGKALAVKQLEEPP